MSQQQDRDFQAFLAEVDKSAALQATAAYLAQKAESEKAVASGEAPQRGKPCSV